MSSSLTLHAWYDVDNGPLRMDYNHFNLYEFIAIIRLNLIETVHRRYLYKSGILHRNSSVNHTNLV